MDNRLIFKKQYDNLVEFPVHSRIFLSSLRFSNCPPIDHKKSGLNQSVGNLDVTFLPVYSQSDVRNTHNCETTAYVFCQSYQL